MPAAAKTATPAEKATKPVKKAEKKLPAVPESKLKEVKRKLSTRARSIKKRRLDLAKYKLRTRQNLHRAQKYAAKYIRKEREVIEKAREAKKAGNIYIPAEAKVAFVMRIRG